jgi:chemotaxis signal transduction protein
VPQRARRDALVNNGGAESVLDLLTFSLGGERCALLASEVREVVRAALPTRLPKAPPIVSAS